MIDLDLLRAFLAVYRAGSVTAAARLLALSQPALTARMQLLETRCGKKLFTRQGRGIVPTSEAHALARNISPHIDGLESVFGTVDSLTQNLRGNVTIATPKDLADRILIPRLGPIIDMGISVSFEFGPVKARVDQLVAGEVDLAILTVPANSGAIMVSPVMTEEYLLVASPKIARKIGPRPSPACFQGEGAVPLLAYAASLPMIRDYWTDAFGKTPSVSLSMSVPDLGSLLTGAVAGLGATVLPDYLCRDELERGRLVRVDSVGRNTISLAWRKGKRHRRTLVVRDFIERSFSLPYITES